jgi:hypothetical protein
LSSGVLCGCAFPVPELPRLPRASLFIKRPRILSWYALVWIF